MITRELYLTDYLSLPWQALKYCYAWLIWKILTIYNLVIKGPEMSWASWRGKRDDPTPIVCERCLWMGMRRWVIHGYQDDGSSEDVVAVDECPHCGYEV